MFFLVYNVSIDWNKSIWYVVEHYGERTEQNVDICIVYGPPAMMHS